MNVWPWFSLTREFPSPGTAYDWPPYQADRPVPTRDDLAALRRADIDFVRLPVDPGPLLAFSGERRRRLFADVAAAVELALAQDLSVIVNLHPNNATHYWNSERLVGDVSAPLFTHYLGLVHDMAAQLARFDPARVAFEPLNEPPQRCSAADWVVMQAELLRTARLAAPSLTLVATGACGSMIDGLEALDAQALSDTNILYTFHFYEPYVFSHQGAPWMTSEPMYRYLNAVPWPAAAGSRERTRAAVMARMTVDELTPDGAKRAIAATIERVLTEYFDARPDRRFIERHFARVAAWADRHRVDRTRILLGEFGALRSDRRYVAASAPDRTRYIADVRGACEAAGMPWAFWNFFDGMGLTTDDATRNFDPAITAALGLRDPGTRFSGSRR
ncbi:MAG: glycoside hydrolase family 5 protein [Alphaproteobacteria bacterium]|nr:MAG: glycoside hydrolase family 5 protein [Alphaproteobacteria bacterium]